MATSVRDRPIAELVKDADHIILAKVVGITVVKLSEKEYKETGFLFGHNSRIQFEVEVVEGGVFKTTGGRRLERLLLIDWDGYHPPLEGFKKLYLGKSEFFFLRNSHPNRVLPNCQRRFSDKAEIQKALKATPRE